ncbi:PKD domain-containing protein, partial [Candidatus Bathyarchaeota archaeon]
SGLGFTKYTVSSNRIDVQTNFSGTYSDSFSLWGGLAPVPSVSWSPLSPQIGQTVTFTASASGGVAPYSFTWDFGDGATATGTAASHAYASANYYNVTLTAVDSANNIGSSRSVIAVGSWNPNVPCVPSLTALSSILGSAYPSESLAGSQWQTNSTAGGIPNKRALIPPCTLANINGRSVPSYVEVDNVYLASTYMYSNDCTNR